MKLVATAFPSWPPPPATPHLHQGSEAEFTLWLRAKLLEEAGEATTASSQSEFLAELGDVLQVL